MRIREWYRGRFGIPRPLTETRSYATEYRNTGPRCRDTSENCLIARRLPPSRDIAVRGCGPITPGTDSVATVGRSSTADGRLPRRTARRPQLGHGRGTAVHIPAGGPATNTRSPSDCGSIPAAPYRRSARVSLTVNGGDLPTTQLPPAGSNRPPARLCGPYSHKQRRSHPVTTDNYAATLDPFAFEVAEQAQHLTVLTLAASGLARLAESSPEGYTDPVACAASAAYLDLRSALNHVQSAAESLLATVSLVASTDPDLATAAAAEVKAAQILGHL